MTVHRSVFQAMNTEIEAVIETKDDPDCDRDAADALNNVQLLFHQVEQTASRFPPDSELSEINQSSGDLFVSPLLFDLLETALAFYRETGGIFQPAILQNLEAAGYQKSMNHWAVGDIGDVEERERAADVTVLQPLKERVPFEVVDRARRIIRKEDCVRLDLGGVAKGWTVDRAVELIGSLGSGYVNAGGDLRVFGERELPWNIGVEDPHAPERDLALIGIKRGAVATSSTWKRRWMRGGKWMHHLMDPATGRPSDTPLVSSTVTAPTAVQADVWAKTVLLLEPEKAEQWIRDRKEHAILVDIHKRIRRI